MMFDNLIGILINFCFVELLFYRYIKNTSPPVLCALNVEFQITQLTNTYVFFEPVLKFIF